MPTAGYPTARTPNTSVPPRHRLRRLRTRSGWTRARLAARLTDTTALDVGRWETGREIIPESLWPELATLFGVSVDYLLGWDTDRRKIKTKTERELLDRVDDWLAGSASRDDPEHRHDVEALLAALPSSFGRAWPWE